MNQCAENYSNPRVRNCTAVPCTYWQIHRRKAVGGTDVGCLRPQTERTSPGVGRITWVIVGGGDLCLNRSVSARWESHTVVYGTLGERHLSPVPHTLSSRISTLHKSTTFLLPVGVLGEDLITLFVRN